MNDKPIRLGFDRKPLRPIADESDLRTVTGGSGVWKQQPPWGQAAIWRKSF